MNSFNWRHVTEFIAVVSIVVSLLFVGIELRENSAIARVNAYNSFAENVAASQSALAADPILAPIMFRAFSGELPSNFSDVERFRAGIRFQSIVRNFESVFRSVQEGVLSEEDLTLISNVAPSLDNPFFKTTWHNTYRNLYSSDFVEYFEMLEWNSDE